MTRLIASPAIRELRTNNPAADLDSIFAAGPASFQPVVPADTDLAALLYTSGTTADPKGVMLTHANLVGEANSVFAVIKIGPDDALLGILPMFHVLAQMANLFLPLFNGARVVYLETLNTTELLRALQERDITVFCVVPQFFYLIHERIFKELNKRGNFTLRLVRDTDGPQTAPCAESESTPANFSSERFTPPLALACAIWSPEARASIPPSPAISTPSASTF